MTTRTCPVVGYLFPAHDGLDFDPATLAAELAEMEANPNTEEYDDAFYFYNNMADWELLGVYRDRVAF